MVKLIAGLMGSSVASGSSKMSTPEQMRSLLSMLSKNNVHELDTARVYNAGKSEQALGDLPEARECFRIATKAPGFSPGSLSYARVMQNCNASLEALKLDCIPLYYFHGPERPIPQTPIEESCRAINDLFQQGKIEKFGVSNCSREEVEEIHKVCVSNGWLLPTVYQGGYNPLGRTVEEKLFPTLRKLGMAFYAYSPLAGGFFSRPTSELRSPPAGGRMDQMKHFADMYVNDLTLSLHDNLTSACEQEGLSLKQATLRFLANHSALGSEDGIILGASSESQMEENLASLEMGPLPESVVAAFNNLWVEYRKGGYDPPYCV